ncbi:MAG: hypothetical protein HY455_01635 [Parcubacteria group bacterium]|nr:hypothetical protein [Parcubacteria group bacterium]
MQLSPVDIFATVFAVLVLVKLVVVLIDAKAWMKYVADPIYKNPNIAMGVYLALLALAAYYLRPIISAAEFGSVLFIAAFLFGIAFLPYAKETLKFRDAIIAKGLGKAWFPVLLWALLAVAVLYGVYN